MARIIACFSKCDFVFHQFDPFVLLYKTGPLRNSKFCFPQISMFPSTSSQEHCDSWETKFTVPLGTSHRVLIVNCYSGH